MRKPILSLLLLLIGLPFLAHAQSRYRLSGCVRDSRTDAPIVRANILILPKLPFAKTQYPFWPTCEPCTESLYRTGLQPEGWR